MILSTRGADIIVSHAFGRQDVAASKLDTIIESMATDPSLGSTKKEAYIVASDDLRNKKAAETFFNACSQKHPDSFVIVIAKEKDGEQKYSKPGVDKVLYRPRPDVLNQIVIERVSSIAQKGIVASAFDDTPETIEQYQAPKDVFEPPPLDDGTAAPPVFDEFDPSMLEVDFHDEVPDALEEIPVLGEIQNSLARRVAASGKVSEISQVVSEINASMIVRDMIAREGRAATLSEMLASVKEKIYVILTDKTSGDTMEQKMQKIRAAMHDRGQYQVSFGSAVEQTVSEIIDMICNTVEERIGNRLQVLDRAIYSASVTDDVSSNHARLATVQHAKANILAELVSLGVDLTNLCDGTVRITQETAAQLAKDAADPTGSALINDHLKARGEDVVPYEVIELISSLMEKGAEGVDRLKDINMKVASMFVKLNTVLKLDKEAITAQQDIVRYLTASKVEDTVIAETLLKKALRVWVGTEGTGRTVVPYVLSKMKSYENANVLLVDLTGTAKYVDYGIQPLDLDVYLSQRKEERFCLVAGNMPDDPSRIQRLYTQLHKAADFYRVINVVVSTEQTVALDILSQDVLCINYITDMQRRNMEFMREFIKTTKKDNVGQRVVLNRCTIPTYTALEALDVGDRIDIALVTIPAIPTIEECAYSKTDPALTETVQEGFKEANKYA